jgi:hypothetical protein
VAGPETPHDWVGKRVEVELIRPGSRGPNSERRWGTLEAASNIGITGGFTDYARPDAKVRRRFYP